MPRTLLMDGDIILYMMAFAVQANQGDYYDLREAIHEEVERWGKCEPEGDIILCLSNHTGSLDARSFRYQVFPEYKKHRQDTDKPRWYAEAADILRSDFYYAEYPTLEGDDVMGILGTRFKPDESVMVSIDKDLLQIPGWHWNPRKQKHPFWQSPSDALYIYHTQWIMGDSTDGYKGIPRMGPKKTEAFLSPFWLSIYEEPYSGDDWYAWEEAEQAIWALYQQKGLSLEYAQQMAKCARILQDVDFDKHIPIL